MFNRELRSAVLRTYGGTDEYGQQLSSLLDEKTISVAFGLLAHSDTNSVLYQDATHYALVPKDVEVNDTQTLFIDNKEYKVKFVNNAGRLKQLFLCQ